MPLTASVEAGQSSPSCSTGGGVTAADGVGVGGGACCAGGCTGGLTSGFSPGSGGGAAGGGRRLLGRGVTGAVGHHQDRNCCDDGNHDHPDADGQSAPSPVDLGGQRAM